MKTITNIVDRIKIDNKLLSALISAVATWALAKYAVGLDPTIAASLAALIAGGVGYQVPNEGSMLRRGQESGNAAVPDDVDHEMIAAE